MGNKQTGSFERVRQALAQAGLDAAPVQLPDSTRTAQEAAQAVGCQVGQIVKSLVFRGGRSGAAYLVLTSGANRVDTARLARQVGEPVEMADADFVRQHTGFSIGGVAPVGHLHPVQAIVDQDLLQHSEIWASAGTPNAVFRLTPDQLQQLVGNRVASVS